MRNLIPVLLLSAVLLATSCLTEQSSDVKQDRIYTQYELFYNANEDITYARGWFRFGNATGTLLDLSAPSQVSIDGELLAHIPLLAYYEKKSAGLKTTGTFHWEDADGKTFDNSIDIKTIGFGAVPDTVGRTAAFEIPWTGEPLGDNEIVGVWINGINEGDAQAAITVETGANSIIVPADKMSKIGAGPGKIYMERRYSPPLTAATGAGGTITGVYRAVTKEVVFE